MRRLARDQRRTPRGGFTLIELLVVIFIIGLLAISTLPVVLPSLQQNSINVAARQLHAELSRQRDQAVRTNRPAGIRLLPDLSRAGTGVLTSNRMIAIEQGPDYAEGLVHYYFEGPYQPPAFVLPDPAAYVNGLNYPYLVVHEEKFDDALAFGPGVFLPNPPTSWFNNIRQGDKIRLNDSGRTYTIAGPIVYPDPMNPIAPGTSIADNNAPDAVKNPQRFINFGPGWVSRPGSYNAFEFLFLTNGVDDDGDGAIDESFDGINNDGDFYPMDFPNVALRGRPCIDPGFNGVDDNLNGVIDDPNELFHHFNSDGSIGYVVGNVGNEFETERAIGTSTGISVNGEPVTYRIVRRPVPSPGARELPLPTGIVIDLTTWDSLPPFVPERSRLPVDPYTLFVDVLMSPNGSVLELSANANPAPRADLPYYHFWLTDADGVADLLIPPIVDQPSGVAFRLPMPSGTNSDPSIFDTNTGLPFNLPYSGYVTNGTVLKGNRRLVSLNARTGQIITTSPEQFATNNPGEPYEAAIAGRQEEP